MTDEANPPVPLEARICMSLLSSGSGSHPICIGSQCSRFEHCLYDLRICQRDLDKMSRHPAHKRLAAGEKWGDKP